MSALWMILAGLLFACMGLCVKISADFFSVGELVFYRGFVSMLVVLILAKVKRLPLASPYAKMHLFRSLLGCAALLCYFFTIAQLPLASAVTLNYTSSLFVIIFLIIFFGEKVSKGILTAIFCGFIGVVLLLNPSFSDYPWQGAAIGLFSGLLAGGAYISLKALGRVNEPAARTVFWFSATASVLGAAWAFYSGWHMPTPKTLLLACGIGVLGGCAQIALTNAYSYGKTALSASLSYSTVIFASLFGWLLWNESLDRGAWLGIILIIGSSIAATILINRNSDPLQKNSSAP